MKRLLAALLVLALLLPALALAEETTLYTCGPFDIHVREGDSAQLIETSRFFLLHPADGNGSLTIMWGEGDHIKGSILYKQTFEEYVQRFMDDGPSESYAVPESMTLLTAEHDPDTATVTLIYSYDRDMGKYYAHQSESMASVYEELGMPNPFEDLAIENDGVTQTVMWKKITIYLEGDGTYFFGISYDVPEDGSTPAVAEYLDEILADYYAR